MVNCVCSKFPEQFSLCWNLSSILVDVRATLLEKNSRPVKVTCVLCGFNVIQSLYYYVFYVFLLSLQQMGGGNRGKLHPGKSPQA